jgi:hypothetical protein
MSLTLVGAPQLNKSCTLLGSIDREDHGEIAKGVNQLGRTRYRVSNRLITGQVNNGSDVPLLGRVCSERRGAPGKLDGPRYWLAGPPGPRAEGEAEAG